MSIARSIQVLQSVGPLLHHLKKRAWWTRQHDSAAPRRRRAPLHPLLFSSFSPLSYLPPQVSARACFHCRLSFPLLFPSLLTLRQVALEALPLSRLPSVSFLFKKKSENAAKSIAHRNKHRATRIVRHAPRNTHHAVRIA